MEAAKQFAFLNVMKYNGENYSVVTWKLVSALPDWENAEQRNLYVIRNTNVCAKVIDFSVMHFLTFWARSRTFKSRLQVDFPLYKSVKMDSRRNRIQTVFFFEKVSIYFLQHFSFQSTTKKSGNQFRLILSIESVNQMHAYNIEKIEWSCFWLLFSKSENFYASYHYTPVSPCDKC